LAEFKDTSISKVLRSPEGTEIKTAGWIYSKNVLGRLIFIRLRDSTGLVQVAIRADRVGEEAFEQLKRIQPESSLSVSGAVRRDDRAPGGAEVRADAITILGPSTEAFPIRPGVGKRFLLDNRHLAIRSRRVTSVLKIRAAISELFRRWLRGRGYIEIHNPSLITAACEGGATLFKVDYFGRKAYLTQSGQLYNEAAITSLEKVFCLQPSFRAEFSRTRRHLTEFWQLEIEEAFATHDDMMRLEEEMIAYVVREAMVKRGRELAKLNPSLKPLEPPFKRITYDEAIKALGDGDVEIEWGADLGADEEKRLCELVGSPVFVTHYPAKAKAFYHKPDPSRPEVVLCHDLLIWPYGEIVGGGQRIDDYATLMRRMTESGLDPKDYQWYIDLRRYGSVPHSGFGLGLERFLSYLCELPHIREATLFPRTPARIYP
jgi:asparaginyl-tRNA synthetase